MPKKTKFNNSSNPLLSVIILSYNTKAVTLECLRKIKESIDFLGKQAEVVVVENGSDGTGEYVKKNIKWAKVIEPGENTGFTKGNNIAIKYIYPKSKYVLLLNSDAFVNEDTLSKAVNFMDTHRECGVLGCKLKFENGKLQPSAGYLPTPFSVITWIWGIDLIPFLSRFLRPVHPRIEEFFGETKKVGWVMGAFFLVRKEVVEKTGGFNEDFFMYMEEVEWCKRINDEGFGVWYTPEFWVTHLDKTSSKGDDAKTAVFIGELKGVFSYLKIYYPGSYHFLVLLIKLGLFLRYLAFWLLGNKVRKKAYFQVIKEIN